MNYNNQNPSYSPFPWLEKTLKNYQENIDYKIEWLNDFKHYTILSERLKKFVEEEWHQKRVKKGQTWYEDGTGTIKNLVKWMKEELPKYQEGVDYQVEKTTLPSGMVDTKYKNLSERMKKGIDSWNETQVEDDWFGNFSHWDCHRQQEWIKKENEKKCEKERQKFIADNDPPLFKGGFLYELDEKEKLFNSQQSPLTEAEKAALNDSSLTYSGDWNEVLWYIQKNRQANSDIYGDEYFAWEGGSKLKGRFLEVVKKAGIPLDKLFQRVEKGRQIKLRQVREKAQQDKATVLAHLNDWTVGADSIHNWKTTQNLMLNKDGNITRQRFFVENWEGGKIDEKEIIDGFFDPATFQELRAAIFQNLLKNLRENKNYPAEYRKKIGREVSEKGNYSPTEWTEIQKAMGKVVPVSESSNKNSPSNSSLRNKLIIASCIGSLIILSLVGGLFLIKKNKRKHGSKR